MIKSLYRTRITIKYESNQDNILDNNKIEHQTAPIPGT